jgi:hypothetical protein
MRNRGVIARVLSQADAVSLRALGASRVSARLGGRVRKTPSAYATGTGRFTQLPLGKGEK